MIIKKFRTAVIKLRQFIVKDAEIARLIGETPQNFWRIMNISKTVSADTWERLKVVCRDNGIKAD